MPYEWLNDTQGASDHAGAPLPAADSPLAHLRLWPFRSLPKRGFVWFIGATAALLAVPLIPLLGSPVLWGILPFLLLAIWAIWAALSRSYRDGEILEDLILWPDRILLTRQGPGQRRQSWEANPHWVTVMLHEKGGPVPQYLTLRGAGREVELGAFLSEDERLALRAEVRQRLADLR
jgi:uncharacterized membrane protein